MTKIGTIFLIAAIGCVVLPYILSFLGLYSMSDWQVFPVFSMIFGSIGVFIHVLDEVKQKTVGISSLLLLAGILFMIVGISLKQLGVGIGSYILLAGSLLIAVWLIVPSNKGSDTD